MIVFTSELDPQYGFHSWIKLMDILEEWVPDFDRTRKLVEDIKTMEEFGGQFGYKIDDTVTIVGYRKLTLIFDDPHRELLFKMKYL